jgi:hypothetical protein
MIRLPLLRKLCAPAICLIAVFAAPAQAQVGGVIPDSAVHVSFSGLLLNRTTTTFDTTASFTNNSPQAYSGVLSLEVPQVSPASVTLANPTCVINNVAVFVFSLPDEGLPPGGVFNGELLKFSDPARGTFNFTHTLVQGDPCGEVTYLRAFSDSRVIDPSAITPLLPLLAPVLCRTVPASPMTLGQAMSSIQTQLNQIGGAGALQSYLAGNTGATPESLTALAASQVVNQRGPAALASLLAAHQNEPSNPAHLVNAAGAAALIGMPNEALALLDAADATGGDFGAPMGIDGHAVALNNRGFALLQTGQFAAAQSVLNTATAAEPYLAEGRMNLAIAQLCQGQDASATYLSALHRSPGTLTLDKTFDLSQGVAPQLTALQYPGSAELLHSFADGWTTLEQGVAAAGIAAENQRQSVRQQWRQRDSADPPLLLTSVRFADIDGDGDKLGTPVFDSSSPPGLSDLYTRYTTAENAVNALYNDVVNQFNDWSTRYTAASNQCFAQRIDLSQCEPFQTVLLQGRTTVREELAVFLQRQGTTEQAFRVFADPWYRDLTGLAANLEDPLYHQDRSLRARADLLLAYNGMVAQGNAIQTELGVWWGLAQSPESPGLVSIPTPDEMDSQGCPDILKAATLQLPLGPGLDASINCEQVMLSLSSPGVGPFANGTITYKGNWTVIAGVSASASVIPPLKAKASVGAYLSGNLNRITDLGIKTSASFGAGPLQIKAGSQVSFAASSLCAIGCD